MASWTLPSALLQSQPSQHLRRSWHPPTGRRAWTASNRCCSSQVSAYLHNCRCLNLRQVLPCSRVLPVGLVHQNLEHEMVVDKVPLIILVPHFEARTNGLRLVLQVICCDGQVVQDQPDSVLPINLFLEVLQQAGAEKSSLRHCCTWPYMFGSLLSSRCWQARGIGRSCAVANCRTAIGHVLQVDRGGEALHQPNRSGDPQFVVYCGDALLCMWQPRWQHRLPMSTAQTCRLMCRERRAPEPPPLSVGCNGCQGRRRP